MLEMAARAGLKKIYLHAFLDGRDTPPRSAQDYLRRLQEKCDQLKAGRIASIIGRYFAMDRDHRWLRVKAPTTCSPRARRNSGEKRGSGFGSGLCPRRKRRVRQSHRHRPAGAEPVRMQDGDVVVFMNFRSDRAREITRAFIEPDFDLLRARTGAQARRLLHPHRIQRGIQHAGGFPAGAHPQQLRRIHFQPGTEAIAHRGNRKIRPRHLLLQRRRGKLYPGEDRILVPSPDVPTYDLKPEMSAFEVTDKLVEAIESRKYDAIICNYANADMVGHTGNLAAAIKAIETLDKCLGRVVEAMQQSGGEVLITADHGNAEKMVDEDTHQAHTAHTLNLVPFLYIGRKAQLAETGALEDVAPTLLKMMGLPQPAEMTGQPLIEFE